jgi:quinol monooxygenase YgiN
MFGMHGCITAHPGQGVALAAIVLEAAEAARDDDACLLYFVSRSLEDADAIWVTEAWTDREAHGAALQDEATKAMIARARPLIAGFSERSEFRPVGGKGLSRP